jgi:hypothetical protein
MYPARQGTACLLTHLATMPLYFFDLLDGDRQLDSLGAHFASDQAARQEASLRALNGSGYQLEPYNGCRAIIVRNEAGDEICKVKIRR